MMGNKTHKREREKKKRLTDRERKVWGERERENAMGHLRRWRGLI